MSNDVPDWSAPTYTQAQITGVSITSPGGLNLLPVESGGAAITDGVVPSDGCTVAFATKAEVTATQYRLMAAQTLAGSAGVPISPGQTYTVVADFDTAATGQPCEVTAAWSDVNGAFVGGPLPTAQGAVTDDGTPQQAYSTYVAPANAAYLAVNCVIGRLPVGTLKPGDVHNVSKLGIFVGSGTTWSASENVVTETALPVVPQSALPLRAVRIGPDSLANGASAAVIAGVAGETVTVYGFVLAVLQGGNAGGYYVHLISSATSAEVGTVAINNISLAGDNPGSMPVMLPVPLELPVGEGVSVLNNAGSAATCEVAGTLYCTQG